MRSRSLTAVLGCVAVALGIAASATAAVHGVLSRAEYHQLQLAQRRIRSLTSFDGRGFTKANAVCTHMQPVSTLLAAVRGGCLDLIRLGGDNDRLTARVTKCGVNPGSEAALLACTVPAVQAFYSDAEAFYLAETRVNRLAAARGFRAACVAVIGDSPANIAAEGRLAQDLKAAINALEQQNPQALQTLTGEIQATVRSIKPGPSSLALCPHR